MASNYFLDISDAPGESQNDAYSGQIDIVSFKYAASQGTSTAFGGGGSTGKVQLEPMGFYAYYGKQSPVLAAANASGQVLSTATLNCCKAGGSQEVFLTVTLSNCIVAHYETVAGAVYGKDGELFGENDIPMDFFTLAFDEIEFEYKEQESSGSTGSAVTKTINVKQNTVS